MIKLKSLLKENTSFDFPHWTGNVKFTPSIKNGKIVLIPSTTKDLDGVDTIKQKLSSKASQYKMAKNGLGNGEDADFISLLQDRLEKKLKLKVISDKDYSGAGYAFQIDMDELLKKL